MSTTHDPTLDLIMFGDVIHRQQEQMGDIYTQLRALFSQPRLTRSQRSLPTSEEQNITEEYLVSLSREECTDKFGFTAFELLELSTLLDIPDPFVTTTSHQATPLEALALLCARFKSRGDISSFNRPQNEIIDIVNQLVIHLNTHWGHLFDFPHDYLFSPINLQHYADAIDAKGAPAPTIWGFIGSTRRRIRRPSRSSNEASQPRDRSDMQRFQVATLPNGLIGHIYGPVPCDRNEYLLFVESGLLENCYNHAIQPGSQPEAEDRYFQLFGDPVYGESPVILSPFDNTKETVRTLSELAFNTGMAAVRIETNYMVNIMNKTWPFINVFWKFGEYSGPDGAYFRVAALLTNLVTCYHGNYVSQFFQRQPPLIKLYLRAQSPSPPDPSGMPGDESS